jgi:hypothetical protein
VFLRLIDIFQTESSPDCRLFLQCATPHGRQTGSGAAH